MTGDYWALAVRLDPEATDAVANFLWEAGALGVVEEGDGPSVGVQAFFPPGMDADTTRRRLVAFLSELRGLAVSLGPATVETVWVPDQAWADAWRAHFRPVQVGRRLLVAPPWERPHREGRHLVVIEPGRAFGTGSHGSTRGCLELLERALACQPAARVLDVGTGSGILAIAAARLGAPCVIGIDPDPDAVAAAGANATRNDVTDRVRVEIAGLESWGGPPADLVLANLLAPALIRMAAALARCCTAPGRLIAGGLLRHEAPGVTAAFVPEGFAPAEVLEREEWVSLLLSR